MPPQRQQRMQPVRDRLGAPVVAPVVAVVALAEHVMQLEEIDHALEAVGEGVVEASGDAVRGVARCRHPLAEHGRCQLHQHQRGGFQRLHESARQSHCHAIAMPGLRAIAWFEAQPYRYQVLPGQAGIAHVAAQLAFGVLVAAVRARVHVADAAPRLQADVPDPSVALRGGHGLARDRRFHRGVGRLHRQRTVVEQHLAHRHRADAVVPVQQHGAHAVAGDERVARDRAVLAGPQRGDVAVLVHVDPGDVVGDVAHPQALDAVPAQEHPELAGIQVVGVVGDCSKFWRREPLGRLARFAQMWLHAHQPGERHVAMRQPAGNQIGVEIALRQHERAVVAGVVAVLSPAHELRTLLECCVAFTDEVALGYADAAQGVAHRRPGALAHADGGQVRRFDPGDLQS